MFLCLLKIMLHSVVFRFASGHSGRSKWFGDVVCWVVAVAPSSAPPSSRGDSGGLELVEFAFL